MSTRMPTSKCRDVGSPVRMSSHTYNTLPLLAMYGDVLTYAKDFPNQTPYLMIAHGGQDENVHFSHTAALLQQLNSLGKPYEFKVSPPPALIPASAWLLHLGRTILVRPHAH